MICGKLLQISGKWVLNVLTFDAKSLLEMIEDILSDFEGDTDADDEFDVDVATDPTSAEIISAPDPLIFAEEEQNPPDVDSSSASAEVL